MCLVVGALYVTTGIYFKATLCARGSFSGHSMSPERLSDGLNIVKFPKLSTLCDQLLLIPDYVEITLLCSGCAGGTRFAYAN